MNKLYTKLAQIFFHYNAKNFKIKHSDYADVLNVDEKFDDEQLKWCKKYVDIVDEALSKLDKYERQLIEHVYIKCLPKNELPYSLATYYYKRNKALKKLNSLLISNDFLNSNI
ncbi:MAG: hypothetical protein K2K73_01620 [Ureaplasma sp.]|nr:hypothetical protein [Ureaplasma sp.]